MTGETLLAYKMPQVLQRVKQRAPHVRLSLQSLNCYVIRDALLSDEVDLGGGYRVGNDDALELMPLGDQSLALVASPLLQHVNFTQYNQHIPCSFIINEPQCVSANLGVSFLPRFAVERELRSGELIELPYSEQPELITALCGYHAGKVVSPAMRVFLECIEESFASREKMPG